MLGLKFPNIQKGTRQEKTLSFSHPLPERNQPLFGMDAQDCFEGSQPDLTDKKREENAASDLWKELEESIHNTNAQDASHLPNTELEIALAIQEELHLNPEGSNTTDHTEINSTHKRSQSEEPDTATKKPKVDLPNLGAITYRPKVNKFRQGEVGSCFALVTQDIFNHDPNLQHYYPKLFHVAKIESNPPKAYYPDWEVIFPSGERQVVNEQEKRPDGLKIVQPHRAFWHITNPVPIIMRAFAKSLAQTNNQDINDGGYTDQALAHMFGEGNGEPIYVEDLEDRKKLLAEAKLTQKNKNIHYILAAGTPSTRAGSIQDQKTNKTIKLENRHAYAIRKIIATREVVIIANPHDTQDAVYTVSFNDFLNRFKSIGGLKIDTPTLDRLVKHVEEQVGNRISPESKLALALLKKNNNTELKELFLAYPSLQIYKLPHDSEFRRQDQRDWNYNPLLLSLRNKDWHKENSISVLRILSADNNIDMVKFLLPKVQQNHGANPEFNYTYFCADALAGITRKSSIFIKMAPLLFPKNVPIPENLWKAIFADVAYSTPDPTARDPFSIGFNHGDNINTIASIAFMLRKTQLLSTSNLLSDNEYTNSTLVALILLTNPKSDVLTPKRRAQLMRLALQQGARLCIPPRSSRALNQAELNEDNLNLSLLDRLTNYRHRLAQWEPNRTVGQHSKEQFETRKKAGLAYLDSVIKEIQDEEEEAFINSIVDPAQLPS